MCRDGQKFLKEFKTLSTLFHRVVFSPFRGRSRMGSLILERASVTYEVEFCRFALDLFTRAGIPATDWSKAFFRVMSSFST